MTRAEIIEKWGKGDDNDDDRYEHAIAIASYIDKPVFMCFEGLRNLEDRGLIELDFVKREEK